MGWSILPDKTNLKPCVAVEEKNLLEITRDLSRYTNDEVIVGGKLDVVVLDKKTGIAGSCAHILCAWTAVISTRGMRRMEASWALGRAKTHVRQEPPSAV